MSILSYTVLELILCIVLVSLEIEASNLIQLILLFLNSLINSLLEIVHILYKNLYYHT